jgi:type III restriction enzyme
VLRKLSGKLEIKNADERKTGAVRKSVLVSPEFKALWDRIKHKTTYRVQFDNDKLIRDCISGADDAPAHRQDPAAVAQGRHRDRQGRRGGDRESAGADTVTLDEADIELPDLLTDLQDRTQLTRRSIARILTESGRLDDFKRNPQQFIELAADAINRCKRWPWSTASSTSAWATSTSTPRSCSRPRS